MNKIALFCVLIFLISGCSTRGNPAYNRGADKDISLSAPTDNSVTTTLYKEYKKWHKTPYKFGGLGLNGVDCSSLVYSVYRDAFGVKLPRTTRDQHMRGRRVDRDSAQAGDLIFFKTGYNTRHVGIIVQGTKFMHAAKSSGVTISDFSAEYWQNRYWQTRRVLH